MAVKTVVFPRSLCWRGRNSRNARFSYYGLRCVTNQKSRWIRGSGELFFKFTWRIVAVACTEWPLLSAKMKSCLCYHGKSRARAKANFFLAKKQSRVFVSSSDWSIILYHTHNKGDLQLTENLDWIYSLPAHFFYFFCTHFSRFFFFHKTLKKGGKISQGKVPYIST